MSAAVDDRRHPPYSDAFQRVPLPRLSDQVLPRAEADRRGIHWIEFAEADVVALPFEDRSFDLVVTYTGVHCFCRPAVRYH